jgi:hypothetical protein
MARFPSGTLSSHKRCSCVPSVENTACHCMLVDWERDGTVSRAQAQALVSSVEGAVSEGLHAMQMHLRDQLKFKVTMPVEKACNWTTKRLATQHKQSLIDSRRHVLN